MELSPQPVSAFGKMFSFRKISYKDAKVDAVNG